MLCSETLATRWPDSQVTPRGTIPFTPQRFHGPLWVQTNGEFDGFPNFPLQMNNSVLKTNLGSVVGNILDTFNFSAEKVQEKLHHLNILYKSTGPDMLHPRILSALEDKLARPLTHIFNNSVETEIIPEVWKSANVTAIHQTGNRQEPGNYRPISLF